MARRGNNASRFIHGIYLYYAIAFEFTKSLAQSQGRVHTRNQAYANPHTGSEDLSVLNVDKSKNIRHAQQQ